jgi:hypothetical protein
MYSAERAISLIREKRGPDALFNKEFVAFLIEEAKEYNALSA